MKMYQIKVKYYLVLHRFPVQEGWQVTVHLDGMELGKGSQHPLGKREVAEKFCQRLKEQGVQIGVHPKYGRADVVAEKQGLTYVIEAEGYSSKQREQAVYSALGQVISQMDQASDTVRYGLAVPDSPEWEKQLQKVPERVRNLLDLELFLVSRTGVRKLGSAE
jgi:hypothetical protein